MKHAPSGGSAAQAVERPAAAATLPALDGARALAVMLVFVVHGGLFALDHSTGTEHALLEATKPVWALGRTGVHLFFVLSGFLLFLPYARARHAGSRWPGVRRFYTRRVRRVAPAYWVALAILALAVQAPIWDVALHSVFAHNASEQTFRSINDVFWSMAVEVQFYVALPLFAVLVRRFGTRVLWVSLLVSPLTQGALIVVERAAPVAQPFFPAVSLLSYWSVFAAGMLCAVVFVQGRTRLAEVAGWLGVAVLVVQVGQAATGLRLEQLDYLLFDTLFGVAYAGVIAAALLCWPLLAGALSGRVLAWVALISYSLYIWHAPMLRALGTVAPISGHSVVITVGFLCAVVPAVGWVSYRLTERPFLVRGPASCRRG